MVCFQTLSSAEVHNLFAFFDRNADLILQTAASGC